MFEQLKFNFGDVVRSENEREPRPSYWRLRLKRVAEQSYCLGRMRRQRAESLAVELLREVPPQLDCQPAVMPTIPFYADRESRCELSQLARRVRNLSPSRTKRRYRELQRIAGQGSLQRLSNHG
jgi:hypothetical protein